MKRASLPFKGRPKNQIISELQSFSKDDPDYRHMKTWSLVYYLGEAYSKFINDAYALFSSANGLNPFAFKSLKKIENDIIAVTSELLNGGRNTCGIVTSGGTESCLLAVKTYRDYSRDKKNIKNPEMILPETAHVAWHKGAEYFNVKARLAPLKKDYTLDIEAVKKLINRNTIMLLGSAPEYPHGFIDPIEKLGDIALRNNLPLHVDACVGGFLLPFMEKSGITVPPWDYRVKGVTSVSADIHKYGFAAKGASTITYRSIDYFKYQIFVYENWPGGIFASPGLLGTRPGGSYSAAWAALNATGENGYIKYAKEISITSQKLIKGINSIPELEVIGNPVSGLFSYKSKSSSLNIYAVADKMEERGWHIDRLQRPEALHAMVTPLHSKSAPSYLADLKKSVAEVKKNPALSEKGSAPMYGMIANLPLRGMIKKNVLNMMKDFYGPDNKTGLLDTTGTGEPEKTTLAEKAAMLYLKIIYRMKK